MAKRDICFSNYYHRAKHCIAQGALTNSKRPESLIKGVSPTHAYKTSGSTIFDCFGNAYTDYVCGLGTNLLGYGNPKIAAAISDQYLRCSLNSISTTIEVDAANELKSLYPFIDHVKFLKTGTEACMAAIKIARAYTGRNKIVVEGYHGWSDSFIDSKPGHGVDPYSHLDTFRGIDFNKDLINSKEIACIIIEPVELDYSKKRHEYLNKIRELCDKTGTLLIFDEVITGMRFKDNSVSNHFGILPDIICLGKAIGGGLPLAVVGGKKVVMECTEYFVSSTFAGDTLALRAFMELRKMMLTEKYNINNLWESGTLFLKKFNELSPTLIRIEGYPTRGIFRGDKNFRDLFFQECAFAGILFGPSWFYNFALIDREIETIDICKNIINQIKYGGVKLIGEASRSPFASKQRSQNGKA